MPTRSSFAFLSAAVATLAAAAAPTQHATAPGGPREVVEVSSAPITERAPPARTAFVPLRGSLVCRLPRARELLSASARHGLIHHLRQYPVVARATPLQRSRAEQLRAAVRTAVERHRWTDPRAAAREGYDTRFAPRAEGDSSLRFFHAERPQEPRGDVVPDPDRPKALVYADAPGRPLRLVGVMWSMRDGEVGPTPGGPLTRWHSHLLCRKENERGMKVPADGRCPIGSRLVQAANEMTHLWLTNDLRSAFAIRRPEPELCDAGLLPARSCRR